LALAAELLARAIGAAEAIDDLETASAVTDERTQPFLAANSNLWQADRRATKSRSFESVFAQ
jgi:hypothetical protein